MTLKLNPSSYTHRRPLSHWLCCPNLEWKGYRIMTVCFFGKYSSRRSPGKEEKIIQCERVRMKIWYFGMRQVSQTVFFEIFLVMLRPHYSFTQESIPIFQWVMSGKNLNSNKSHSTLNIEIFKYWLLSSIRP